MEEVAGAQRESSRKGRSAADQVEGREDATSGDHLGPREEQLMDEKRRQEERGARQQAPAPVQRPGDNPEDSPGGQGRQHDQRDPVDGETLPVEGHPMLVGQLGLHARAGRKDKRRCQETGQRAAAPERVGRVVLMRAPGIGPVVVGDHLHEAVGDAAVRIRAGLERARDASPVEFALRAIGDVRLGDREARKQRAGRDHHRSLPRQPRRAAAADPPGPHREERQHGPDGDTGHGGRGDPAAKHPAQETRDGERQGAKQERDGDITGRARTRKKPKQPRPVQERERQARRAEQLDERPAGTGRRGRRKRLGEGQPELRRGIHPAHPHRLRPVRNPHRPRLPDLPGILPLERDGHDGTVAKAHLNRHPVRRRGRVASEHHREPGAGLEPRRHLAALEEVRTDEGTAGLHAARDLARVGAGIGGAGKEAAPAHAIRALHDELQRLAPHVA
jgi:hypothetical protein